MQSRAPHDSAYNYQGENQKLTDSAQITGLLKQVMQARALVSVTLPGEERQYNSTILEINPEQGYLLLDELTPEEGHRRLCEERRLLAYMRLKGIDLQFVTTVQEIGGSAGIAFYRVNFPGSMHYRQRRAHYRVKIGMGMSVPLHLDDSTALHVDGELCDLSQGGIGARVQGEAHFDRGQVLPCCTLDLPRGERLTAELEIRFVQPDEHHQQLHIGGRFVNLGRDQQKLLRQFVREVERDLLRRMRRE